MGAINSEMKDTLQARLNHEKALKVVKENKIDSLLSWAYLSLGNVESNEKENYQKGIDYYKKSIELNSTRNNFENIFSILNIAWTYLDENLPDDALPYLLQAKNLFKKNTPLPSEIAQLKILIGRYHTQKMNYTLAEKSFLETNDIIKTGKYPSTALEFYKYYVKLLEMKGDYKKAYTFLKKEKELDDKRYERDKLREVQAASTRFNIKEYERTIESARKEQIINDKLVKKSKDLRNIFILSSLILLIVLIGIYFVFKSRKKYIRQLHEKNNQLITAKDYWKMQQLKTKKILNL